MSSAKSRDTCNYPLPAYTKYFTDTGTFSPAEEECMKKAASILACVVLLSSSAYPFRLGLEFQTGSDQHIGVNMRINDLVEIKPALGFSFSDNDNRFRLLVNGNFYLPQIMDLQHYAGPGIALDVHNDNTDFSLNGNYGLRYDFNEVLSTFGEVGLVMQFDPFVIRTLRAGVGLTIFFPNFQ